MTQHPCLFSYTHTRAAEDEMLRLLPRVEHNLHERVMLYREADCHP